MRTKTLLIMLFGIAFLFLVLAPFVQANIGITKLYFEDDTSATSKTITQGDVFNVVMIASSQGETLALEKLELVGSVVILEEYEQGNEISPGYYLYDNTYTIDSGSLPLGTYKLRFTAKTSITGQTKFEELDLVIEADPNPPIVAITFPVYGGTYPYSVDAEFTLDDPEDKLASCYYKLNGGANILIPSCSEGINQITGLNTVIGINTLAVYAEDTFGNIGSDAVMFSVTTLIADPNPPIVAITFPAYGGTYTYSIDAEFTLDVPGNNLDSCYYKLNGGANILIPSCSEGINQITGLNTVIGNNLLRIYANNTVGEVGYDTVIFTLTTLAEAIPPVITPIEPQNNEILNHTDVVLKVALNEAGNIMYSLNGAPNLTMTETSGLVFESAQLNLENEKTHTVTYYATDVFGNTASLTITFSIDKNKDSSYSSDSDYSTEDIEQYLSKEPTIELENQNPKLNWWQKFINFLCRLFGLEEIY